MKRINPHYQSLYNYDVDQDDDEITIILQIPNECENIPISVNTEISPSQKYGITVEIPNEPPFVCGTLFADIIPESVKTHIETKKINRKLKKCFEITFQKKTSFVWPALIVARHPISEKIDPMSTYLMYILKAQSIKEEDQKLAQDEILYAVNLGLPVASRVYAQILFDKDEREKGISVLKSAANEYNDPDALDQVGRILCYWKKETRREGLDYLRRASRLGKSDVNGLIGQILSPFSEFEYDHKDPKEAVHFLRLAIEDENDELEVEEEIEEKERKGEFPKIEEEEEDKDTPEDEEPRIEKEFEIDNERSVYQKELDKILASGIIEESEKRTKAGVVATVATVCVMVGVALFLHFRKKH